MSKGRRSHTQRWSSRCGALAECRDRDHVPRRLSTAHPSPARHPQLRRRSWPRRRPSRTVVPMPYTYIVECSDGSYYCGSTWQLDRRIWEHNHSPNGAAYTRHRRPVQLVWAVEFDSIAAAFEFEKQVQNWGRAKREALIRGEYEVLPQLARRTDRRPRPDGDPGRPVKGRVERPPEPDDPWAYPLKRPRRPRRPRER